MAKVKKSMKKYDDGGFLQEKPKKAAVKMVESEMTPGKMIPESAVRKGAYITMDKKAAPKKAAPKKAGAPANKMKAGGSLKPVAPAKKKSLGKLPEAVRHQMGYKKDGGNVKAKSGASMKKCKYGCK